MWPGTSTLTIRETQRRSWSAGGVLTVTSQPLLDFVGGSKFTTDAEFTVRPGEGGCQVGRSAREVLLLWWLLQRNTSVYKHHCCLAM